MPYVFWLCLNATVTVVLRFLKCIGVAVKITVNGLSLKTVYRCGITNGTGWGQTHGIEQNRKVNGKQ